MVGHGVGGNIEAWSAFAMELGSFSCMSKKMGVHRFSKMIGWMSVPDLHTRLLYQGFLLLETGK